MNDNAPKKIVLYHYLWYKKKPLLTWIYNGSRDTLYVSR